MTAAADHTILDGLALYVHWPFCLSKCPYCDFNSHVRKGVDQARWRDGLRAELRHAARDGAGRAVESVFFGGGTPSLMAPETVAALLADVRTLFPGTADPEVTLEGNPTSVEAGKLAAFRDAGINRLSLGVQALDDDALRFLGRGHSAAEARAAIELAASLFDRFSFDLISARPGQSEAAWIAELDTALTLAGAHLSVYQLTIEPATVFAAAVARGDFQDPAPDPAGSLYEATLDRLEAAGLPAYEISNHAAPYAECRHNVAIWRGGDYLGIGPGAHGRVTRAGVAVAAHRIRTPEAWLGAVEARGHGLRGEEPLDADARFEERVMTGLRLAEGIPRTVLDGPRGAGIWARTPALMEAGYLEETDDRIRATRLGWLCLNAVTGALLA